MSEISPSDIWAVGHYDVPGTGSRTLIEHWDGSSWSVVPSPDAISGGNDSLHSVSAVSTADAWAVGEVVQTTSASGGQALIEHWDGNTWSLVAVPNLGTYPARLPSVSAASSTDVWAVGSCECGGWAPLALGYLGGPIQAQSVVPQANTGNRAFLWGAINASHSSMVPGSEVGCSLSGGTLYWRSNAMQVIGHQPEVARLSFALPGFQGPGTYSATQPKQQYGRSPLVLALAADAATGAGGNYPAASGSIQVLGQDPSVGTWGTFQATFRVPNPGGGLGTVYLGNSWSCPAIRSTPPPVATPTS